MGKRPVSVRIEREVTMRDDTVDEAIEFLEAGRKAKGQYRCSECGYGVTVHDELPTCPMCSATVWEQASWSPFLNARSRGGTTRAGTVL
jgi:lipopolysaccharide biosynthesis regulator YciM